MVLLTVRSVSGTCSCYVLITVTQEEPLLLVAVLGLMNASCPLCKYTCAYLPTLTFEKVGVNVPIYTQYTYCR